MRNIIKYASLLLAAAMLFACEGVETNDTLKLTSDKNLLQLGEEATLTVTLGTKVITEGVVFYDSKDKVLNLPDFKFKATEVGKYEIWANYGSYISEAIAITVTDLVMPEAPADPKPESTNFKVRSLITEFTTTGCSWCPSMKALLHEVLESKEMSDKVVMTACHSSLVNSVADPALIKTEYESFSKSTGMPYVFYDMYAGFPYSGGLTADAVKGLFNELCDEKAGKSAGIAVSPVLNEGQLIAKVTVKAAKTAAYWVGAFLLEDGIYGKQTSATADWMHNHDNVIRYIDASYYVGGTETFYGHSLGEIEAGKTADYAFAWLLDDIWKAGNTNAGRNGCEWEPFVEEKLHMAVFVCTTDVNEKGEEFYRVVNAIDCPINAKTPFEYAE